VVGLAMGMDIFFDLAGHWFVEMMAARICAGCIL